MASNIKNYLINCSVCYEYKIKDSKLHIKNGITGLFIKRSESTTVQTNLKLRNIDTDSSPVERLLTGYQHYINNLAYGT